MYLFRRPSAHSEPLIAFYVFQTWHTTIQTRLAIPKSVFLKLNNNMVLKYPTAVFRQLCIDQLHAHRAHHGNIQINNRFLSPMNIEQFYVHSFKSNSESPDL